MIPTPAAAAPPPLPKSPLCYDVGPRYGVSLCYVVSPCYVVSQCYGVTGRSKATVTNDFSLANPKNEKIGLTQSFLES